MSLHKSGHRMSSGPLRDTADCSPAHIAPLTYPDLADHSAANSAPTMLRQCSGACVQPAVSHGIRPSPVCFNCLGQIVINTWEVEDLVGSTLIIKPRGIDHRRPSDVSAPALSPGGQLVCPVWYPSCPAELVLMASCSWQPIRGC